VWVCSEWQSESVLNVRAAWSRERTQQLRKKEEKEAASQVYASFIRIFLLYTLFHWDYDQGWCYMLWSLLLAYTHFHAARSFNVHMHFQLHDSVYTHSVSFRSLLRRCWCASLRIVSLKPRDAPCHSEMFLHEMSKVSHVMCAYSVLVHYVLNFLFIE